MRTFFWLLALVVGSGAALAQPAIVGYGPGSFVGPVIGTATNDDAAAGRVGEYVTASRLVGAATGLTTNTPVNITSISLTAGDWDVSGVAAFGGAGATNVNYFFGSISLTSATQDSTPGRTVTNLSYGNTPFIYAGDLETPLPPTRVSVASTTTVYLVVQSGFVTSTLTAYGTIRARRVR